jgi:hypothetical protein
MSIHRWTTGAAVRGRPAAIGGSESSLELGVRLFWGSGPCCAVPGEIGGGGEPHQRQRAAVGRRIWSGNGEQWRRQLKFDGDGVRVAEDGKCGWESVWAMEGVLTSPFIVPRRV